MPVPPSTSWAARDELQQLLWSRPLCQLRWHQNDISVCVCCNTVYHKCFCSIAVYHNPVLYFIYCQKTNQQSRQKLFSHKSKVSQSHLKVEAVCAGVNSSPLSNFLCPKIRSVSTGNLFICSKISQMHKMRESGVHTVWCDNKLIKDLYFNQHHNLVTGQ